MNWATPSAPAGLRAVGSKRLSCQISRVKKLLGRSLRREAASSAPHRVTVVEGAATAPGDGAPGGTGVAALADTAKARA